MRLPSPSQQSLIVTKVGKLAGVILPERLGPLAARIAADEEAAAYPSHNGDGGGSSDTPDPTAQAAQRLAEARYHHRVLYDTLDRVYVALAALQALERAHPPVSRPEDRGATLCEACHARFADASRTLCSGCRSARHRANTRGTAA